MSEIKEIKISVRNLVEFIERTGDLDNRSIGSSIRAIEGTRAHQRVQKSYGENYTPELSLKYSTSYNGYKIDIEGRADGLLITNEEIIMDEIKSTTKNLEEIKGDNLIHWGQVKCYGYIYCQQEKLEGITLQLTYYNIETHESKKIKKHYTKIELQKYLYNLIENYSIWIDLLTNWREERNASIKELEFPFPNYRKGQRDFAVAVYKTIKENKKGFFQAPTGIGKTISTLFPTIKAMGEDKLDKVFYLTAKTVTRQVAEEAVNKMNSNGLRLKTVTITAKDKICFMEEANCNPEYCPYAHGHFDRINGCLLDILQSENIVTKDIIHMYAEKYNVCPFELSLDIAIWSDCVICDYNYAFDPRVYLKRFFDDSKDDYVFLVDEAHNLVDRAREMFSCDLNKKDFLNLKKVMKGKNKAVSKALNKINIFFIEKKKILAEDSTLVDKKEPKELLPLLASFVSMIEIWLQELKAKETNLNEEPELIDLFFKCHQFLKISEFYGENYVTYYEKVDNDFKLKILCLDPSKHLKEAMERSKSTILFSATLSPLTFYRDVLGGDEGDYLLSLTSPFNKDNLAVIANSDVSTYYKDRESSIEKIVDNLYWFIQRKRGNYFAFFPSYIYLTKVYESFVTKYGEVKTLVQEGEMGEEIRDEFLKEFKNSPKETMLAFAVMGGIFSEGIDLVGEKLIGAAIIGVGLPQMCLERDLIMDYYNNENKGFEYSYMYPGFNKVLQSAGRVIRTEKDNGVILLIDKRYKFFRYKQLFPSSWHNIQYYSEFNQIDRKLRDFWKGLSGIPLPV